MFSWRNGIMHYDVSRLRWAQFVIKKYCVENLILHPHIIAHQNAQPKILIVQTHCCIVDIFVVTSLKITSLRVTRMNIRDTSFSNFGILFCSSPQKDAENSPDHRTHFDFSLNFNINLLDNFSFCRRPIKSLCCMNNLF